MTHCFSTLATTSTRLISYWSAYSNSDIKIFGLQSTHRLKNKLPWKAPCQIYSLKTSGQTTIYWNGIWRAILKVLLSLISEDWPVPNELQSCCLLAKVKSSATLCHMILSGMRNAELPTCASSHPTTLGVSEFSHCKPFPGDISDSSKFFYLWGACL